ncbi:MAG: tRNA lysidine(34) synthetase TilS [Corynebacterium sp.]|nr:tRNA lysidine(34) synthetase TilS [Corynebacterium sp.]
MADSCNHVLTEPFWPRVSPSFARCRKAVRTMLAQLNDEFLLASAAASTKGTGTPPTLAVGLSGGADSLALTAALAAETRGYADRDGYQPWQVTALCVDHQLQKGSNEVAQRAAQQARRWGLAAIVLPVDVDAADIANMGVEAAARRARYRGIASWAGSSTPVCVAHTRNDQAETLLLSSLRGHATGMSSSAEIEGVHIVRPFLHLSREDTRATCVELSIQPWSDPHNDNRDFRRVAVRKEVLPLLENIHRGDVISPLSQAAADIAEDNEFIDHLLGDDAGYTDVLTCSEVAGHPGPLRRRLLVRWLQHHNVGFGRRGLGDIEKLCTDWHGQGGVAVGEPKNKANADPHRKKHTGRLEVQRIGGKLTLLRMRE